MNTWSLVFLVYCILSLVTSSLARPATHNARQQLREITSELLSALNQVVALTEEEDEREEQSNIDDVIYNIIEDQADSSDENDDDDDDSSSPRRRGRRMVQVHVARDHHGPRAYYRQGRTSRRGRLAYYRKQRAGTNANISDH